MALDLSALTNPYGQELAGIERNRALASALVQSGSQQPKGEMISGRYVAPSFAQQINPLLQTGVGLYAQNQADKKQLELANTAQAKQAQLLRAYAEAKTPAEKFAIGTNPYAPAALQTATMERFKPQKIGADESLLEYDLEKGYVPSFTGPSKLPAMLDVAVSLIPNLPRNRAEWTPAQALQVENKVRQLEQDKASKNIVNIPNFAEKTFAGGVAESQVKKFDALQTAADSAPTNIAKIQEQRKILESGKFFSGKTANVQQDMAMYADALGLGGKDTATKAANTQSLITGSADSTLTQIAGAGLGSGQGFTDKDLQFLQDARSFRITMNKENIKRVLDLQEKANLASIQKYNQRLQTIPKSAVNSMGLTPIQMPNSDLFNAADAIIRK